MVGGADYWSAPHCLLPDLLPGRHTLTVGAVLLTMEIAGVRRRMEREMVERRDIVFIHAVAERRGVGEPGNQNSGQRAEPDVYYVVVRPPSTKGPTGVVPAQWAQAILLRERRWRDGEVDASDVGYKNTQQVFTRGRRNRDTENAIKNSGRKERIPDVLSELLVARWDAAIPVILHGKPE